MFSFLVGSSSSSDMRSLGRLLSRVEHSSVIDEKVDALQQLADCSITSLTENKIAEQLIKVLVKTVNDDDDADVHTEILKVLCVMTTKPVFEGPPTEEDITTMQNIMENGEMILSADGSIDALHLLLSPSYSAMIRLFTLQLLLRILKLHTSRLQESILNCSGFIKTLIETLISSPEILRNEAILLLDALVCGNPAIQGIAAFEGVFESLLAISKDENGVGIVACDCYKLILSLLQDNPSNVNYFRELGCISLLPALFCFAHDHLIPRKLVGSPKATPDLSEAREEGAISPSLSEPSGLDLLTNILERLGDQPKVAQAQLCSPTMVDCYFKLIDDSDNVSARIRCSLLRILGRSLVQCKQAQDAFALYDNGSRFSYIFRMALDCQDIELCSNSLFVLECMYFDNSKAQITSVSTLAPIPQTLDINPIMFGQQLIEALNLWQSDRKSLRDPLHFWVCTRLLSLMIRRNETAKQIVINTSLFEPFEDVAAPRFIDMCVKGIQAAFDNNQADSRVRCFFIWLLCECLIDCREAVVVLLDSAHLCETLLSMRTWKSPDPLISGLSTFIWALCLAVVDIQTQKPKLHRIIKEVIGLDTFKACLHSLQLTRDFQNPRNELSFEPLSLTKINMFDSFMVEKVMQVYDLCDSRILTLIVSRDDDVSSKVAVPSSIVSDELIAARSRITDLELQLSDALSALASKTDDAALTRYRLDLAQKELKDMAQERAGQDNVELEKLRHEHNELLEQHNDLLLLLGSYEKEACLVTVKAGERAELLAAHSDT
uniref:Vesicle tethering protein Uso1/P115-like head domain-containing protein n=1 Tax=Spongospora subterranea TaxID=70186 RepID=A0A0H5R7N2_9EUKA|eukprot:CRZ09757.1 hypothetical protein [Spongospora subterranea]